jgi:hypothetical protein
VCHRVIVVLQSPYVRAAVPFNCAGNVWNQVKSFRQLVDCDLRLLTVNPFAKTSTRSIRQYMLVLAAEFTAYSDSIL